MTKEQKCFEGFELLIEMKYLAAHCWVRRNTFDGCYDLVGFIEINGSACLVDINFEKEIKILRRKLKKISNINNIKIHGRKKNVRISAIILSPFLIDRELKQNTNNLIIL